MDILYLTEITVYSFVKDLSINKVINNTKMSCNSFLNENRKHLLHLLFAYITDNIFVYINIIYILYEYLYKFHTGIHFEATNNL